jgi:hypothetical protein
MNTDSIDRRTKEGSRQIYIRVNFEALFMNSQELNLYWFITVK